MNANQAVLLDQAAQLLTPHYQEPHRAYHGLAHIQALLRHAQANADLIQDKTAVDLAIWFHDAIYDVHRQDNEELSAQLAEQMLVAWSCAPSLIRSVSSKVSATSGHQWHDGDPDTAVFLDLDLSILAASPCAYDAYSSQIAQEYAWVPADAYRLGRAKVLQGFLARPRLYFTERFHRLWEPAARANLAREWAALTQAT